MRISDWSSDVCSSDLRDLDAGHRRGRVQTFLHWPLQASVHRDLRRDGLAGDRGDQAGDGCARRLDARLAAGRRPVLHPRSEEHTSELQSLMRISYAVFCLKNKNTPTFKTKYAEPTTYLQHIMRIIHT